jgi:hypothetical protein
VYHQKQIMDPAADIPLVVIGSAIAMRMHIYRQLKKFVIPVGLAAVLYRSILQISDKSVLTMLHEYVCNLSQQKRLIVGDIIGLFVLFSLAKFVAFVSTCQPDVVVSDIINSAFTLIKSNPFVKRELQKERTKMENVIDHDLKSKTRSMGHQMAVLPQKGLPTDEILTYLKSIVRSEDACWESGRVSGSVYHGDRNHQNFLNAAFGIYSLANPLHPDMWPSSTKLEAEIISMTANMMSSTIKTVCGY